MLFYHLYEKPLDKPGFSCFIFGGRNMPYVFLSIVVFRHIAINYALQFPYSSSPSHFILYILRATIIHISYHRKAQLFVLSERLFVMIMLTPF